MFTIEHWVPQSQARELAREYSNVLLACRLCNRARGSRPVSAAVGQLLDPSAVPWAEHFRLELGEKEDHLVPGGDAAKVTERVYELNEPRKASKRCFRRLLLSDRQRIREEFPAEIQRLLELGARWIRRDRQVAAELFAEAARLREDMKKAMEEWRSLFPAVPEDAPQRCRCGTAENHTLPPGLEEQMIEL